MKQLIFVMLLALSVSCSREINNENPPLDRPYFPTGMAQKDGTLFIISSNFDDRYRQGAALSVNLDNSQVTSSAYIPSHGGVPVFANGGNLLLIPTRKTNEIAVLDVSENSIRENATMSASGADPYHIAIIDESAGRVRGLIGYMSGANLKSFTYTNADRKLEVDTDGFIQLDEMLLEAKESLTLERQRQFRVRGLKTFDLGGKKYVFVAIDRSRTTLTGLADIKLVQIIWFPASIILSGNKPTITDIKQLDMKAHSTSGFLRGFDFYTNNGKTSLFTIARNTELIARFDLTENSATPTGFVGTCKTPMDIKVAAVSGYFYVACFGDDSIESFDATTLVKVSTDKYYGRGPFQLQIDNRPTLNIGNTSRIYVSFQLDGSIGIFDAVDGRLTRTGRIFEQAPLNVDGGIC